ncbi:hypothetical protein [Pseudochrobactrum lubricantis]|uniref:hypothetical protein n=1 Tax=Pseudochrobactrum lubricantis TaxID=558172 RepID=UPI0035DC661C
MKLYYATGTCSLSPDIVACEASVPLDLERVDIRKLPHVTGKGDDYSAVNPSGYVPAPGSPPPPARRSAWRCNLG